MWLRQITELNKPTRDNYWEGLVLITIGLFKKVLIGDAAARIVDNIFGQPGLYLAPEILAGLMLFSVQIYADFVGYSNIASGVAKLFGINLTKIFEQHYLSRSFSKFWKRWHISLSSWIWDYLFNPFMSAILCNIDSFKKDLRGKELHTAYAFSLIITMMICGLWHGPNYTFIIWGGLRVVFL